MAGSQFSEKASYGGADNANIFHRRATEFAETVIGVVVPERREGSALFL